MVKQGEMTSPLLWLVQYSTVQYSSTLVVGVPGMGSTVAVSVMPVGSGTVGLLPMNGYPSSPLAGGAAKPNVGCSGKPKCGRSAPAERREAVGWCRRRCR